MANDSGKMLRLVRTPHWQRDLLAYLSRVGSIKGEIGAHDCVIFSAGGVNAMTGWYPDPSLFEYRSIGAGMRQLRAMGYTDVASYLNDHFPSQHPTFARAGDLALITADDHTSDVLGIVQGEMIYVVGTDGLSLMPTDVATQSWKVG